VRSRQGLEARHVHFAKVGSLMANKDAVKAGREPNNPKLDFAAVTWE